MTRGGQLKIRDNMDGVLESAGFFRKHMANEPDSLYRAVSDVFLGSQVHKDRVREAVDRLKTKEPIEDSDSQWTELRLLAVALRVRLCVVRSTDVELVVNEFTPDGSLLRDIYNNGERHDDTNDMDVNNNNDADGRSSGCRPKRKHFHSSSAIQLRGDECQPKFKDTSSAKANVALLSLTPPNQFDPIYKLETIETAGFVQSILYELLYQRVLKLRDAAVAADEMLNGIFDPRGKPDFFDPEFKGTATEALRAFKIPFPYKVAKTLDPNAYRNIEYDVWHCEKKMRRTPHPSNPSPRQRLNDLSRGHNTNQSRTNETSVKSIGRLRRGTPCIIRDSMVSQGDIFALADGLVEEDKRYVHVHVPPADISLKVLRKAILPLKELPPDVAEFWNEGRSTNRGREVNGEVTCQLDLPYGRGMDLSSSNASMLPMGSSSNSTFTTPPLPLPMGDYPHYHIPGSSQFFFPRAEAGGYDYSPFVTPPLMLGSPAPAFFGSGLPTPHGDTGGYPWNGGYQFFQYPPPSSPMVFSSLMPMPSDQAYLPPMQPPVSPFDFANLVQALNQGI